MGLVAAALIASIFGSVLLYLLALWRLSKVARLEHADLWSQLADRGWLFESPVQAAGRFMLQHWGEEKKVRLKERTRGVVDECERMFFVTGAIMAVTFVVVFAIVDSQ